MFHFVLQDSFCSWFIFTHITLFTRMAESSVSQTLFAMSLANILKASLHALGTIDSWQKNCMLMKLRCNLQKAEYYCAELSVDRFSSRRACTGKPESIDCALGRGHLHSLIVAYVIRLHHGPFLETQEENIMCYQEIFRGRLCSNRSNEYVEFRGKEVLP